MRGCGVYARSSSNQIGYNSLSIHLDGTCALLGSGRGILGKIMLTDNNQQASPNVAIGCNSVQCHRCSNLGVDH